jgi:hypothetical protein
MHKVALFTLEMANKDYFIFIKGFNVQHVFHIVTRSCRDKSHRAQAFYSISRRAQGRDKNYTNYKSKPQTKPAVWNRNDFPSKFQRAKFHFHTIQPN